MFVDHKLIIKELSSQVETMSQYLHYQIKKLKEIKMKEVSKVFESFSPNINNRKQRIKKGSNKLKIFII